MVEGVELFSNEDVSAQMEVDNSIYFTEVEKGEASKLVDFVLVWEEVPSDPDWSKHKKKREIFLQNLESEGLELENDGSEGYNTLRLRFVKIHAPMEVLKRYAEILKIRMPIKVDHSCIFTET